MALRIGGRGVSAPTTSPHLTSRPVAKVSSPNHQRRLIFGPAVSFRHDCRRLILGTAISTCELVRHIHTTLTGSHHLSPASSPSTGLATRCQTNTPSSPPQLRLITQITLWRGHAASSTLCCCLHQPTHGLDPISSEIKIRLPDLTKLDFSFSNLLDFAPRDDTLERSAHTPIISYHTTLAHLLPHLPTPVGLTDTTLDRTIVLGASSGKLPWPCPDSGLECSLLLFCPLALLFAFFF